MHEAAAAVAGLLVLASTVPYARDILQGRAQPNRASWLMWSFLFLLTALLQYRLESGWAPLITLAECLSCVVIFGLSIRHGVGGLTKLDLACYIIWAAAIGCWFVADRPLLALHCSIIADLVAMAPTLIKIIKSPQQESVWPFAASAVGGVLAFAAVSHLSYSVVAYPVYILAINAVAAMLIQRRVVGRHAPTIASMSDSAPTLAEQETLPVWPPELEQELAVRTVIRPKRVVIIGNTCSA